MPIAAHDGVETYYETFGSPTDPTLLLVNGLGSQCIMYRDEWCERFVATGHHVVRFDNRDMGRSTHHEGVPSLADVVAAVRDGRTPPVPYTLTDMAGDAVAVLDDLGVDRAHVMGLSMGGMIVQRLAIDHPARLRSVTSVMSTTGEADVGQMSTAAAAHFNRAPATSRDDYVAGSLAGLAIWGSPGHVDEADMAELYGAAFDRRFDPSATARQVAAVLADGSRADDLARVELPVLVMHGTADTLIDPSGGRRTAELVPGAQHVEIDGMGHDYPRVFWDLWVETWRDFVGRLEG